MPRSARKKSRSGIYHVMWRGANRQEIFHDDEDCMRFLDIMEKYKVKSEMSVYAWCLMNNHVHLLLKEGPEGISVSMKRVGVSYALYYNGKYQTTGHLFQGRFTSENVEDRQYFLTVIRYIHQNPVKAGITRRVDEWKWSSCIGYYGEHPYPRKMLDHDFMLKLLSEDRKTAIERFKEFNESTNEDECLDEPVNREKRLQDEEARLEIKKLTGVIEIAQVKSLPKLQRDELLRKIKGIDRLPLRQAARILGIPVTIIYRA